MSKASLLNEYLPQVELEKSLGNNLDKINWILSKLDPSDKPLFQNKKSLAKLHHALNVEKYSQLEFRQNLLLYAPRSKVEEFLSGIGEDDRLPIDEDAYRSHLAEVAAFEWGNNDKTRTFIEVFNYPEYLLPAEQKTYTLSEFISKNQRPYKPLKDYQSQIFFHSVKLLENPNQRFLIQMPTGSGKTRVAIELVTHFLNDIKDKQVLWLADRTELCEQAIDTFMEVWPHVAKKDLLVYRLWHSHELTAEIKSPSFIVSTYQKMRSMIKSDRFVLKPDLIIVDEAHHVLAPTYKKALEELVDAIHNQTRLVGLTATPGRGTKSEENRDLVDFFLKKIIEINSMDLGVIEFLQKKKVLAYAIHEPIYYTEIEYKLTASEWKQISVKLSEQMDVDYPVELVKKIAADQNRNLIITKKLLVLAEENRQVLFFSASVEQSKMLCGLMLAKGYTAAHVDGSTPINYRNDVVNKFKRGQIKFIFNYEIFATGFDAPNIDTVFIARPTSSIVLYSQMIGRGMRGPQIGGTEVFRLVEVIDKISTDNLHLDGAYSYFSEYWSE